MSDRVAFLRKTYGLLGIALLAFALFTGGMMRFMPETSLSFSSWAFTGRWNWIIVMVLFMAVGAVARHLALNGRSRGLQVAGLGIAVLAQSILLQPLLWVVMIKFGDVAHYSSAYGGYHAAATMTVGMTGQAASIIMESIIITLAIFVGLTLTVFITKKDFSFMRGVLTILSFGALGVMLASIIFGFSLGAIFLGFMIALMGGYILYQTSMIMSQFPPQAFVAAALMLFSTIATLFWYVLQMVMSLNDRR